MIIGKRVCDVCGRDCTALYGFIMEVRGNVNPKQQEELNEVKERFGKYEFVLCWGCMAKNLGIKEIKQKEQEQEKPVAKNEGFFRKAEKAAVPVGGQ